MDWFLRMWRGITSRFSSVLGGRGKRAGCGVLLLFPDSTVRYRKFFAMLLCLLIAVPIYRNAMAEDGNESVINEQSLENFYASALQLSKSYIICNHPEKSMHLIETLLAVEHNENCMNVLAMMIFDVVEFYCRTNNPLAALESSALLENL